MNQQVGNTRNEEAMGDKRSSKYSDLAIWWHTKNAFIGVALWFILSLTLSELIERIFPANEPVPLFGETAIHLPLSDFFPVLIAMMLVSIRASVTAMRGEKRKKQAVRSPDSF